MANQEEELAQLIAALASYMGLNSKRNKASEAAETLLTMLMQSMNINLTLGSYLMHTKQQT